MKLNYSGVGFSEPFPHLILDNLIDHDTVEAINAEWPSDWEKEDGRFTKKWSSAKLPPTARKLADAVDINEVERLTGVYGLIDDPGLYGGGLHCIPEGGFLKMHCDFNAHPNGWHRRINMLIYFNFAWQSAWGGQLILSKDGTTDPGKTVSIEPVSGRCVLFETNNRSWHGHPTPVVGDRQRRSMALYFYTEQPPEEPPHSTIYRKK